MLFHYEVMSTTSRNLPRLGLPRRVRILTGTEGLIGLVLITRSASLAFLEMPRDWRESR